jgi:hypothetical protein
LGVAGGWAKAELDAEMDNTAARAKIKRMAGDSARFAPIMRA